MIKKYCVIPCLLITLCGFAVPGERALISVNGSAFFPTKKITQKIYGPVWPCISIAAQHIFLQCWQPLSLFTQIDFLWKHGCSCAYNQATAINMLPITVGVQWTHIFSDTSLLSFSVGPRYYYMKVKNYTSFVSAFTHRNGCGIYFAAQYFYNLCWGGVLTASASYSYMKFKARCSTERSTAFDTHISGINLGIGIGYNY